MSENHASFVDKQKYSDIWQLQIRNAVLARGRKDITSYHYIVEALIISLFPEHRAKVRHLKESIPSIKGSVEYTDTILEFIIDMLQSAGFLQYIPKKREYGTEDMDDMEDIGDDNDATTEY